MNIATGFKGLWGCTVAMVTVTAAYVKMLVKRAGGYHVYVLASFFFFNVERAKV